MIININIYRIILLVWLLIQCALPLVESTGPEHTAFQPMSDEDKANACDFRQGKLINGDMRSCKYTKIGWHGSEARFKKSLESGISTEGIDNIKNYTRLLGYGFYISDSAAAIQSGYMRTPDSILCSIYAPTTLFSKQWTEIYIPGYVEVSSEGSEPSIISVSSRYQEILERKGKLEDHPEYSDPLLMTEFDGDAVPEMEMMIPQSKFKYLQADCSPLSTFGRLKPLDMNWNSLINKYSDLWKVANYDPSIKSARLREFASGRTDDGEDISEERT